MIRGLVLASAAGLLLVVGLRGEATEFGRVAATVTAPDGTSHELCLLHAGTREQHRRGLTGVTSLGDCDGMVFTFSVDTKQSFWMRGTPLPLSVAYFDARGRLISTADMSPCGDHPDCPHYRPAGPYRYALEVLQGQLPRFGIVPGTRLRLSGRTCP